MNQDTFSRRTLLLGAVALVAASPLRTLAQGTGPAIHVMKDPELRLLLGLDRYPRKRRLCRHDRGERRNASDALQAGQRHPAGDGLLPYGPCGRLHDRGPRARCGHSPVFWWNAPDAVGLAVPGMPYGSPGMGPESQREAYFVYLIRRDGTTETFSSYQAA